MVTYARGRPTNSAIDQSWPWQVQLTQEQSSGRVFRTITAWLAEHAPKPEHERRTGSARGLTRYTFKRRDIAEAFQAVFGGEVIDAAPKRKQRWGGIYHLG